METISLALSMLAAVIVSAVLVRAIPVAIPTPLVQIGLGAAIAAVSHREVQLDPEIFFLLFLPPLLFLDGWRISKEGLLRDRAMILELALGLVIGTVAVYGVSFSLDDSRHAATSRVRAGGCRLADRSGGRIGDHGARAHSKAHHARARR